MSSQNKRSSCSPPVAPFQPLGGFFHMLQEDKTRTRDMSASAWRRARVNMREILTDASRKGTGECGETVLQSSLRDLRSLVRADPALKRRASGGHAYGVLVSGQWTAVFW